MQNSEFSMHNECRLPGDSSPPLVGTMRDSYNSYNSYKSYNSYDSYNSYTKI